jgi:hypothetical protein
MTRLQVIVSCPEIQHPTHQVLALGVLQTWACVLYTAGADVFAPYQPLDPDEDPLCAVAGTRGVSLRHDGGPPTGAIGAVVYGAVVRHEGTWSMPARIVRTDQPDWEGAAHRFRGAEAPLRAMVSTVRAVARVLDLDFPDTIGWRELLGVRTVAKGLRQLDQQGLDQLAAARAGQVPVLSLN